MNLSSRVGNLHCLRSECISSTFVGFFFGVCRSAKSREQQHQRTRTGEVLTVAKSGDVHADERLQLDLTLLLPHSDRELGVEENLVDAVQVLAEKLARAGTVVGHVAEREVVQLVRRRRALRVAHRDRVELLRAVAGGVEHEDGPRLPPAREQLGDGRHAEFARVPRHELAQHVVHVAERERTVLVVLHAQPVAEASDDGMDLGPWRCEAWDLTRSNTRGESGLVETAQITRCALCAPAAGATTGQRARMGLTLTLSLATHG